ncbi:hypothetical protein [Brachyspira aalborgi]|nr:hypothetical protein [Brachyspira aalborgi]
MYSNIFSSEIRQQNRTLTGLPSVAEQNYYKAYFIAKQNLAKFISVV